VASSSLPLPSQPSWLLLRPYTEADVRTVVGWQSAEPELPRLLGLEEPPMISRTRSNTCAILPREANQRCSAWPWCSPRRYFRQQRKVRALKGMGVTEEERFSVEPSFALHGAYEQQLDGGAEGAAEAAAALASSLAEGSSPPPPLEIEIEIEIERLHRR
jgi:hypothetical protein